ncbi:MAG: hypothetical protein A3J38_05940 [Gammaproteobacteria bacterium RIFCSPHIGHO2_12_FULL_45_9]|nr:MAG: hypothetical protein A3J38_05940 [Gammaproteobacteria bacterium RIFCSPHIGHO2_12_FULL_45_9]
MPTPVKHSLPHNLLSYPAPQPGIAADDTKIGFTIGDLHGNTLKLLGFLVVNGLVTISEEDYQQFTRVYFDTVRQLYWKPTEDGKTILTFDSQGDVFSQTTEDGKPAQANYDPVPPFPDEAAKLAHFDAILSRIQWTAPPRTVIRLIGDSLADRGSSDIFTLQFFAWLLQQASTNNCTIEDIFSNHNFEFLLVDERVRKMQAESNALQAQVIQMLSATLPLQIRNAVLASMGTVIQTAEPTAVTTQTTPILAYEVLSRISEAVEAALTPAVHSAVASAATYSEKPGNRAQYHSVHMEDSIARGTVTHQQIQALVDEVYIPMCKLISYSLAGANEITVHTHAPAGLRAIRAAAAQLGVAYHDHTAIELANTIDAINAAFSVILREHRLNEYITEDVWFAFVEKNTVVDGAIQITNEKGETNRYSQDEYPILFLAWNRMHGEVAEKFSVVDLLQNLLQKRPEEFAEFAALMQQKTIRVIQNGRSLISLADFTALKDQPDFAADVEALAKLAKPATMMKLVQSYKRFVDKYHLMFLDDSADLTGRLEDQAHCAQQGYTISFAHGHDMGKVEYSDVYGLDNTLGKDIDHIKGKLEILRTLERHVSSFIEDDIDLNRKIKKMTRELSRILSGDATESTMDDHKKETEEFAEWLTQTKQGEDNTLLPEDLPSAPTTTEPPATPLRVMGLMGSQSKVQPDDTAVKAELKEEAKPTAEAKR